MLLFSIFLGSALTGSFEFVGPLSELPREVRRSADASLQIDPALVRRVVYVRSRQEDLGLALQALSKSLGAKLITQSGSFTLKEDQSQTKTNKAVEQLEREQRILKFLKSTEGNLAPDKIAQAIVEARPQNAAHLVPSLAKPLHINLLASIGSKDLANIEHSATRVWSNQPTLVEASLPASVQNDLSEYKTRVRELKRIAQTWDPVTFGPITYETVIKPILEAKEVGKLHLRVKMLGNSIYSSLFVFDSDGKKVGYDSLAIPFDWKAESSLIGSDDKVSLEPSLQNLLEETAVPFRAAKQRVGELLARLDSEPHKLVTQPLLKQLAEHENASIAVELTDRAFRDLADKPPKTGRDLCSSLEGSGVSLELKDGWLTSRITLASMGHELGLERTSLRKWLGAAKSSGSQWLRAEALLAADNGKAFTWSPLDNWVRVRLLMPLREELVPDEIFPLPILQALGNLNEVEWNNLVSGRDVRVNPGTSAAERLLSFSYDTFALEAVPGRRPLADLEKTGTVSLQHGIPLDSRLRLSRLSEHAWKAPEFGPLPRTFSDLGNRIGSEIQSFGLPEVSARMKSKGIIGSLFFNQITIFFGQEIMYNFGEYETQFLPITGVISFEEWDVALRDSFMRSVRLRFDKKASLSTAKPP